MERKEQKINEIAEYVVQDILKISKYHNRTDLLLIYAEIFENNPFQYEYHSSIFDVNDDFMKENEEKINDLILKFLHDKMKKYEDSKKWRRYTCTLAEYTFNNILGNGTKFNRNEAGFNIREALADINFKNKMKGWLYDDAPYYVTYYDVDKKFFEENISMIIEAAVYIIADMINEALEKGELQYEDQDNNN